jgi:hypothetical protein
MSKREGAHVAMWRVGDVAIGVLMFDAAMMRCDVAM